MKESKFLLSVGLIVLSSLSVAVAYGCTCGPEPVPTPVQGGFAFASFGNGAAFSWSNYVAPVVKINQNGTSTTVTTTPGYFKNSGSNNTGKFVFNKNMYTVAGMNKLNPDIIELQKVLVADGVLGQNAQTGVYDAVTKAAVEAFQKKHGIKPAPQYTYGYFGPITRNYLNTK